MKRFVSLAAVLAAIVAICLTPVRAQSPSATSPHGIAQTLQPYVDSHTLAGAVTLVASKDKVLSLEAVGYADVAAKKPMNTDSLFWIASMTKPITATALMMLVDEGKVNVDDPVEKYLPEFKGQMLAVDKAEGPGKLKKPAHPITVKNLLTHTSGMATSTPNDRFYYAMTLAEAVRLYAKLPLHFEPGSKWEYNNPGLNTVGRIVEVVSGKPYEEFVEERLFTPLGMTDTTFWPYGEQLSRLAKSYKPSADKKDLVETPTPLLRPAAGGAPATGGGKGMPMPAGGLFSTASDVSVFCRMLLNDGVWAGKRYLSQKSLRQMTSMQTEGLPTAYGFGWMTGKTPGAFFGHGGAYKTDMRIDLEHGLVMVFLVQHADWGGERGKQILPAFHQAAIKAFAVARAAEGSPSPSAK